MPQELVLANFDTEGTTNRSPCNTMHRSPVAHGIGAHWSVGPGVQRARPMSSNNLQKLGSKTTEVVLQLLYFNPKAILNKLPRLPCHTDRLPITPHTITIILLSKNGHFEVQLQCFVQLQSCFKSLSGKVLRNVLCCRSVPK